MIKHTDEVFLGPEDILEIDIPPKVSNSAGYQNIVTMVCVFAIITTQIGEVWIFSRTNKSWFLIHQNVFSRNLKSCALQRNW